MQKQLKHLESNKSALYLKQWYNVKGAFGTYVTSHVKTTIVDSCHCMACKHK